MDGVCVDPGEIQEGALLAYVDGTAEETVIQHIRRCPACARQVEELAALQTVLTIKLHRFSCPNPDQLIAYRAGELGGNEKLIVVQHLRQCPHCARELAALVHNERPGFGERVRGALKVLEATLVAPRGEPVSVRGDRGVSPAPQAYRAEEVEVIINQRPSLTSPRGWDLSGLVHIKGQVPETIGKAKVQLYRGEGLIAVEPVSPRGLFTIQDVESTTYDLFLVWEDRGIWLRGVTVA